MKRHSSLWKELCSYENLESAFNKARKHKTLKIYVIQFEKKLQENLLQLQYELLSHTYNPQPLSTFIIRDPKTRKISKSHFRDRVVHHALCNMIEPIFDETFIYDSYANRKRKGCLKAIRRFDYFKRKVSKNGTRRCFVLKADVKHYFETVDHKILLTLIRKKIKDRDVLWLIKTILSNYNCGEEDIGMPLGNLTSQFFANIYLNELDQFVKHKLRVKYYLRYVDDFVILHNSKKTLEEYKTLIDAFLKKELKIELHPDKSKIIPLDSGILLLGFRVFYYHMLVRKKNLRKFERRFRDFKEKYANEQMGRDDILDSFEGWMAYIVHANTYKYRRHLIRLLNKSFPAEAPPKNQKQENLEDAVEVSKMEFSAQKTLKLFKSGKTIKEIAKERGIKESTVWSHLAKLTEHGLLSVYDILTKEKIKKIQAKIKEDADTLKLIKSRLDNSASYNEIQCVVAFNKRRNRKRSIRNLVKWYRKTFCLKKCHKLSAFKKRCLEKLKELVAMNPQLQLSTKKFMKLIIKNLKICKFYVRKKKLIR